MKNIKVLGLINARGGSKGVPRKNIKLLGGQPLIAWSIKAGLKSKYINKLIVSTDDSEIAEVSRSFGAEVPFMRPKELASDSSLQIDSIKHAISFLEDKGEYFDIILLLQPTTPLRKTLDIDSSLELLIEKNADTVISVTDVGGRHPATCYKPQKDYSIVPYIKSDERGVLRQEFNPILWRNGAIYATKRNVIIDNNSLYGESIVGYEMGEERSFNIDSLFDWNLTEAYIKYSHNSDY